MPKIRSLIGACALLASLIGLGPVSAATAFASPAFQKQWQAGETIAANFWGPLATAKDSQQEPYKEAPGGTRLVQYFDKGRMELSNGAVTNGLLATELIKGQVQTGDATFQPKAPPAIPIAGDPDNAGPTYAQLSTTAAALLAAVPKQLGAYTIPVVSPAGVVAPGSGDPPPYAAYALYEFATHHDVSRAFFDYREKVGMAAIGIAISEPFFTTVKVAGKQRQVLVQVFERRVLTYTPDNPPAFQVEMGNIGLHYYQWRYPTGLPLTAPPPAPSTVPSTATPTDNWAGYDVETKNITAVHAAWVVPAVVAPPATGYAATWVGIGGVSTPDLIQAGTEQDIEDGVPIFYAWVELLPDDTLGVTPSSFPVHPGDLFSVTITNTGEYNWIITLEDRTTNQRLARPFTYDSCLCSAEWVEELPDIGGVDDPAVANFGTARFTEVTATVGGAVRPVGTLHPEALALGRHGKIVARPQPIEADGTSFAVSFIP